mgnify:CR=1 FL=1
MDNLECDRFSYAYFFAKLGELTENHKTRHQKTLGLFFEILRLGYSLYAGLQF